MGKRSTSRRLAVQILYQMDLCEASFEQAAEAAFSNTNYIDETINYAKELAKNTWENKKDIDEIISEKSKDWSIDRLAIVDKNILRLALYELLKTPDLSKNVIINEAVELAKKFSDIEAPKFINGILGSIQK